MKLPNFPAVFLSVFLYSFGFSSDNLTILSGFSVELVPASTSIDAAFNRHGKPLNLSPQNSGNLKNSLLPSIAIPWESNGQILESDGIRVMGLRSPKVVVSNVHGDFFALDSHLEGGEIYHLVNGADYGWRRGSAKKPDYFEDILPPILKFETKQKKILSGAETNYPEPYRQNLFSVGENSIHFIRLVEQDASYIGEKILLYKSDQTIIDMGIHTDGLLYFKTNLGVYKITCTSSGDIALSTNGTVINARQLRRNIVSFHNKIDPSAVDIAWPSLSSPDRVLRHAARLALESQPLATWQKRALSEGNPQAIITAAIALSRAKDISKPEPLQEQLFDKLYTLKFPSLTASQQLGLLRAYSLAFSRLTKPSPIQRARLIAILDPQLPSKSELVNLELLKMLVYLRASTAIDKGIKLIESPNSSEPVKASYARYLSYLEKGWTMEQRQRYFRYLKSSKLKPNPYLDAIHVQALAGCSDEERDALSALTGETYDPIPNFSITEPVGPGQNWTQEQAVAIGFDNKSADFEKGRNLYFSIGCASCHRINGLGGGIGPDLSAIPHKFDVEFVVESILNPNKKITNSYDSSKVKLKDGTSTVGIAVEQGDKLLIYSAISYKRPKIIPFEKVATVEPIELSQMPSGLLARLNKDEVRDLLAYLMAGGNSDKFDPSNK